MKDTHAEKERANEDEQYASRPENAADEKKKKKSLCFHSLSRARFFFLRFFRFFSLFLLFFLKP